MTAQLANGGFKIYPKITVDENQETFEDIKRKMLQNSEKKEEENILPQLKSVEGLFNPEDKEYTRLYRNPENVKFVLESMFASTNEQWGTSYKSRIDDPKYQFAGKTGTSQVKRITESARELDLKTFQIPYDERDHALYVAFGPYKNPRYAISVFVEHGGSGSVAAAPIAKNLFKLIIDRHELREQIRKKNIEIS